jgi:thymidine kinase
MRSGKSITLGVCIDRWRAIGLNAKIISPTIDTRSSTELVCHNGERREVIKLDTLQSFLTTENYRSSQVIGVDEAQFFEADDLFSFANQAVDIDHKTTLTALCSQCNDGTPAIFTKRVVNSSYKILIGDCCYASVCRKHF